jgi:uncharacterized protein YunC (DUF1805 family)
MSTFSGICHNNIIVRRVNLKTVLSFTMQMSELNHRLIHSDAGYEMCLKVPHDLSKKSRVYSVVSGVW